MSECGSFVTEFLYCNKCLNVLKENMEAGGFDIECVTVCENAPIIAGRVSGSYSGGELLMMEFFLDEVKNKLCHDIKVAVISDSSGSAFYSAGPSGVAVANFDRDLANVAKAEKEAEGGSGEAYMSGRSAGKSELLKRLNNFISTENQLANDGK